MNLNSGAASKSVAAVRGYFTESSSLRKKLSLHWWAEILVIVVFYSIYTLIRNQFGSDTVTQGAEVLAGVAKDAYENAKDVIAVERFLGLFQEHRIQDLFLDWTWFISFWNVFYGFFHFAITTVVLVWLYVRFPKDFARWRTIGLITTALGLIGYALFPLMPPRLLGAPIAELGANMDPYGFLDTVKDERFWKLWSYNSGTFQSISNQYAAMPSLHFAWAGWCTMILYPRMRRTATKTLAAIYPVAVLFAIVVTANHYWLDAVGGLGALAIGYAIGDKLHHKWRQLRSKQAETANAEFAETSPD